MALTSQNMLLQFGGGGILFKNKKRFKQWLLTLESKQHCTLKFESFVCWGPGECTYYMKLNSRSVIYTLAHAHTQTHAHAGNNLSQRRSCTTNSNGGTRRDHYLNIVVHTVSS